MQLRRVRDSSGIHIEIAGGNGGFADAASVLRSLPCGLTSEQIAVWSKDAVSFLGAPADVIAQATAAARTIATVREGESGELLLPFEPRSFRDFMIYEEHAIGAARGFARRFMPVAAAVAQAYEALSRRPFPAFRPRALWYRQPIYYMGNHLSFVTDGAAIAIPPYATQIDYELELSFVLARGLFNAEPAEAEAAIGGFAVLNDFSAREVQLMEMRSGFGPVKAKHFASSLSPALVSAGEFLPRWRDLQGFVKINGDVVSRPRSGNPRWTLGEMLSHASRGERLHAGELFGTGTFPGGSGIEAGRMLSAGDTIELGIEGIGSVKNTVVRDPPSEGREREEMGEGI